MRPERDLFLIETWDCIRGPWLRWALAPVPVVLQAGKIWTAADGD